MCTRRLAAPSPFSRTRLLLSCGKKSRDGIPLRLRGRNLDRIDGLACLGGRAIDDEPLREAVRTGGRNTAGRGSAPTPDPVSGSSSWKPGPTFVREVMPLASLSLGSAMACFAARRSRLSPLFMTYDCQEVSGWS